MPTRARVLLAAALVLLLGGVALVVVRGDDEAAAPASSSSTSSSTTSSSTTEPPSTTTTEPPVSWPALPADGVARAVITPAGLPLAVLRTAADGRFVAHSPCGNEVTVSGTPVTGAHVVLDAGHGGEEPGAVGAGGLRESDVNLAVAREAQRRLEALGAEVLLTRTADYRITLASRADIVTSIEPALFISIHHNAEPDAPWAGPGSETYFQIADPQSKRASGLVYEELVRAFRPYDIAWMADTDAGAKYRLARDGDDYYGILRRTSGVPAVLAEAAFISNPAEEALLADPAFQATEAEAITQAVVRYVRGDEPGGVFTEPYPRDQPAGSGGGARGCVDPPLG